MISYKVWGLKSDFVMILLKFLYALKCYTWLFLLKLWCFCNTLFQVICNAFILIDSLMGGKGKSKEYFGTCCLVITWNRLNAIVVWWWLGIAWMRLFLRFFTIYPWQIFFCTIHLRKFPNSPYAPRVSKNTSTCPYD